MFFEGDNSHGLAPPRLQTRRIGADSILARVACIMRSRSIAA
jgi:hypothetical protein